MPLTVEELWEVYSDWIKSTYIESITYINEKIVSSQYDQKFNSDELALIRIGWVAAVTAVFENAFREFWTPFSDKTSSTLNVLLVIYRSESMPGNEDIIDQMAEPMRQAMLHGWEVDPVMGPSASWYVACVSVTPAFPSIVDYRFSVFFAAFMVQLIANVRAVSGAAVKELSKASS